MRTFTITILLGFIVHFTAVCQDSIVIRLNLSDCHNCYGGFCSIEHFPTNLNPTILVKEADQKIAVKFIRKTLGLTHNYKIIYSDSLYNKLSMNVSSEVFVYKSGELTLKYNLSEFKNTDLNYLFHKNIIGEIPDSIMSNKAIKYSITDSLIILQDLVFNEIHVFDYKANKLIKSFNDQTFNIDTIYKLVKLDTISVKLFKKIKPQLRLTRNDKVLIDGCKIMGRKLYLTGNYPILLKSKRDSLFLLRRNFLAIFQVDNLNNFQFLKISEFSLDSVNYFPIPSHYFILNDSTFVIRSLSSNKSTPYNLSLWKLSDNKIQPFNLISNHLPEYYIQTGLQTNLLNEVIAWPFLMYNLVPEIKNIVDGGTKTLPLSNSLFQFDFNNIANQKFNFQIFDAISEKGLLKILFLDHENQYVVLEIDGLSLITKRSIYFPKKLISPESNVIFYDKNHLSLLCGDGEIQNISF